MRKLKNEARQKIVNEEEAIVRDYYVKLLNEKERIAKEYRESLKHIEEKEMMLDSGKFEIRKSMEMEGLSIFFNNLTIK